jgi:4-amino-4-deoxy-L-arabinose transferase-like glycosyltransferase
MMVSSKNFTLLTRFPYWTLCLLGLLMLIPGTVNLPLVDRDAALFAQASKQMVESQDYWHIQIQQKPRHRKPPGYYWLQAASAQMLPPEEFNQPLGYRLPALLASLLSVLLLYFFASKLFTATIAWLASATLAGSFLFIIETHIAATDSTLLCCMIPIFGILGLAYNDKKKLPIHYQLTLWLALAAGILIKGIAPLFALTTIISLAMYDRSLNWLKYTGIHWGLPLLLILTLAWLLPLNHFTETNFVADMLRIDFLPKLVHGVESHGHWPGYYFILFHVVCWPFTLFFWPLIATMIRYFQQPKIRFVSLWLITNWLALELVPTKLPGYLLPLLPSIACLIAVAIVDNAKLPLRLRRLHQGYYLIWMLVSLVFITSFVSLPYLLQSVLHSTELAIVFVCAVVVIGIVTATERGAYQHAFCAAVGLAMLFNTALFDRLLPRLDSLWITEQVVRVLKHHPEITLTAKNPLWSVDYHEPSLIFRVGTWRVRWLELATAIRLSQDPEPHVLLLPHAQVKALSKDAKTLATFDGFHYSKGRFKTYSLICIHCQSLRHA